MRAALVVDGRVANVVQVPSLDFIPGLVDGDGLNIGDPIDEGGAPMLPQSIPMLNLNLVLIEDGHLSAVEQKLADMPGEKGQRARAYWAKALTARRDNEFVNELWSDLYLTEAEFDDAWRRAAAMNP